MFFILLLLFSCTETVVMLNQTKPENNLSACPGESLTYECIIEGIALVWQENTKLFLFNSPAQINKTVFGERFAFKYISIEYGYKYASTAHIEYSSSSDSDITLTCTDGEKLVSKNVSVRGTFQQ